MRKGIFIGVLVSSLFICFSFSENISKEYHKIQWVKSLESDLSFIDNWSYAENTHRDTWGQLNCRNCDDSLLENYMDEAGIIYWDSMSAFYEIVDTSHYHYNLECDAWTYEFAGANYIRVWGDKKEKVWCASKKNVSTQSSLILEIEKKVYTAWIVMPSTRADEEFAKFPLKTGELQIDKRLWNKGFLAAEFDFTFENSIQPEKDMFWKGTIYAEIEKKD